MNPQLDGSSEKRKLPHEGNFSEKRKEMMKKEKSRKTRYEEDRSGKTHASVSIGGGNGVLYMHQRTCEGLRWRMGEIMDVPPGK